MCSIIGKRHKHYIVCNISGNQVDGNLTLGENLADHGGLNMALAAYKKWRENNTDSRLPALDFDDLQLFFLGRKNTLALMKQ